MKLTSLKELFKPHKEKLILSITATVVWFWYWINFTPNCNAVFCYYNPRGLAKYTLIEKCCLVDISLLDLVLEYGFLFALPLIVAYTSISLFKAIK